MQEVKTNKRKVSCYGNGFDNYFDHPLIYLDMGEEEKITCPYCERKFYYDCTVEVIKEGRVISKDEL